MESTLVVHVHVDGAVFVEGEETDLHGLSTMLATLPGGGPVLFRADARLPWVVIARLLETCGERKIRDVFHAVLPQAGDEEGAFSWPLTAAGPGKRASSVGLTRQGPAADPAQLFGAARAAGAEHVTLHVVSSVPLGLVLRACDALRRAGVRTAGICTAIPPQGAAVQWHNLKALARKYADGPENISITFDGEEITGGAAVAMPTVERVRGGTAGFLAEAGGSDEDAGAFTAGAAGREKRPPSARPPTEDAVELGLKWLLDHQDLDGKWDCDSFMHLDPDDDKCDGAGAAPYDVGVTGLALLAFLGAGYTDRHPERNPYAGSVGRGLRYLIASQGEDGFFGASDTPRGVGRPRNPGVFYNHVIATLAMCEAYWMTRNPRYRVPAQNGLNRIAMARNPDLAWRYVARGGDNDTSITAWCVVALRAGKFAGLEVDPAALRGARAWIEGMTAPDGRVGYTVLGGPPERAAGALARWPPDRSQSMTAAGILARILLGEDPRDSGPIAKGVKLCVEQPPSWNPDRGSIDMYYWYWGTLAMFQVGGRPCDIWNKAMQEAIVKHQHQKGSGSRTGSWDPLDPWGNDGGRVYSTALMTMCLEVYYRYDRR